MMKFMYRTKTAVIFLLAALILLGVCIYMIARPISFGMEYYHESTYQGKEFSGVMKFSPDNTMVNRNTNFDIEMTSRYYYKDGYIFFTSAETDEDYAKEVKWIDDNFTEALNMPFYASRINAFKIVAEGIGDYDTTYTCKSAIIFVVLCVSVELIVMGFSGASFILSKKAKYKE